MNGLLVYHVGVLRSGIILPKYASSRPGQQWIKKRVLDNANPHNTRNFTDVRKDIQDYQKKVLFDYQPQIGVST